MTNISQTKHHTCSQAPSLLGNAPAKNFSRGLLKVDIPELGNPLRGKVRDNWIIKKNNSNLRLVVTTDRHYAFLKPICTISGKGQILNLISEYWFRFTKDIVLNHFVTAPHPNLLIARQAAVVLPVEVILRRYMSYSTTPTSIYYNYIKQGRRNIYGIRFSNGLKVNQELPMGTILTPTTKMKNGHDTELNDRAAQDIVDNLIGVGGWEQIKTIAHAIFERARIHCLDRGLILADTKFEFGLDGRGNLMLIDEILTPECSRLWLAKTYESKMKKREIPEPNKDVLNAWLIRRNFFGKGKVPVINMESMNKMLEVYTIPYQMITGKNLPHPTSDPAIISESALNYIQNYITYQ